VRGIHPLEIAAEGETCQDTGRKGLSKGHSLVLTLWGPLREGYGRTQKAPLVSHMCTILSAIIVCPIRSPIKSFPGL